MRQNVTTQLFILNKNITFIPLKPNLKHMNKSVILRLGIIALSLIAFCNCEYEPSGLYERDVDHNVLPPEIQIIELNIEKDSIYLTENKTVRFNFTSNNQDILGVEFLLDLGTKSVIEGSNGTYTINTAGLFKGHHTLTMNLYTKSGTGSIADMRNIEAFKFTKVWDVFYYTNESHQIDTNFHDGYLRLSWESFKNDFKNYTIKRNINGTLYKIGESKTNYFIDSTYFGEEAAYQICIGFEGNTEIEYANCFFYENIQVPDIELIFNETNHYYARFKNIKYYKALDGYNVYEGSDYSDVKFIKNISANDTLFEIGDKGFPEEFILGFQPCPSKNNIWSKLNPDWEELYYGFLKELKIGFIFQQGSFINISSINQINADDFVYFSNNQTINRFSIKNRKDIEYFVQPDGIFLKIYNSVSGKTIIVEDFSSNEYFIFEHNNLTEYSRIPRLNMIYSFNQLSDINTTTFLYNDGFLLYNYKTLDTLAFYRYKSYLHDEIKISITGDYFIFQDDSIFLKKLSSGIFQTIKSFQLNNNDVKYFEFHGTNPEHLVYCNSENFYIKKCSDFSNVSQFKFKDEHILYIDYYNKELLSYTNPNLNIRDIDNGELKFTLKINVDPLDFKTSFILINHAIICSNGVIYFTNIQ